MQIKSNFPNNPGLLQLTAGPTEEKATSLGVLGLFSLGLAKKRVDLNISSVSQGRFKVAAEIVQQHQLTPSERRNYILIKVLINGTEEHLKVNRNSLVKRLGISSEEIHNAEALNNIDYLSHFVSRKVNNLKRTVEYVDQELAHFNSINTSALDDQYLTTFKNFLHQTSFIEREKAYREINQIMSLY